jgi:hypothetical protein
MKKRFLMMAFASLLIGCEKNSAEDRALNEGPAETVNHSSEQSIDAPSIAQRSEWTREEVVDKMSQETALYLRRTASTARYKYELEFRCSGDGARFHVIAFDKNDVPAEIPWSVTAGIFRSVKIRAGNYLRDTSVGPFDNYSNAARLDLLLGFFGFSLPDFPVPFGSEGHDAALAHLSYFKMQELMSAVPLYVSGLLGDDVIEVRTRADDLVTETLDRCRTLLPPLPTAQLQDWAVSYEKALRQTIDPKPESQ